MGTRLLSENRIRQRYPHLHYVRVHTCGKHKARIYAWDGKLQLSAKDAASLQRFASGNLLQHVCYDVLPYDSLRKDGLPQPAPLPELLSRAALRTELQAKDIVDTLNSLLPGKVISFRSYDAYSGTIQFNIFSARPVSPEEQEQVGRYVNELVPVGCQGSVHYVEVAE
ncbi:hypothetical protein DNH61_01735 [Paenibacillus sambharensis]|uniref:Uncharacterized protein n=1 Tax=Paenibacillus sambharensis TaxID=1803190 RepID=A0A2W1LFZ4_9BACL|nr:hypothetical protein [Paenibacillus sambharensis]PZD97619.1 hypothetical protein DNH61_01735 [Paenibacillus sambharensis]